MAGGSNGYQAALVRRQLTPGLISSSPGTAGLPPSISFSTSCPERTLPCDVLCVGLVTARGIFRGRPSYLGGGLAEVALPVEFTAPPVGGGAPVRFAQIAEIGEGRANKAWHGVGLGQPDWSDSSASALRLGKCVLDLREFRLDLLRSADISLIFPPQSLRPWKQNVTGNSR